jgi:chaperonin GroES
MIAVKDRIIVTQETPPSRTKSGIIIPEELRKKTPIARVISVGNEVNEIKSGDEILMISNKTEEEFTYNGQLYGLIKVEDIECKIHKSVLLPMGDRLVIYQDESETETKSGLIIPKEARKSKRTGEIMAIGNLCKSVAVGERIYFSKMAGKMITFEGITHTFVSESDIQCKIIDGKIYPLNDMLIVKQDGNTVTSSGIELNPMDAIKLRPNVGEVIHVGSKVKSCKLKDRVFFSMYAGRKLEWEGEEYVLLLDREIQTIIPKGVVVSGGYTQDHEEFINSMSGHMGDTFDSVYGADRANKLEEAGDYE